MDRRPRQRYFPKRNNSWGPAAPRTPTQGRRRNPILHRLHFPQRPPPHAAPPPARPGPADPPHRRPQGPLQAGAAAPHSSCQGRGKGPQLQRPRSPQRPRAAEPLPRPSRRAAGNGGEVEGSGRGPTARGGRAGVGAASRDAQKLRKWAGSWGLLCPHPRHRALRRGWRDAPVPTQEPPGLRLREGENRCLGGAHLCP